jgi:hypothetical protein
MAITALPGGTRIWRAVSLALRHPARRQPDRPAVIVDADRHPQLHDLVRTAARQVGAPPPERVRLAGTARVAMRGQALDVGLPLVYGLSADQLHAVVAHELALPRTRYRRLVRRLLALRAEAGGALDPDTQSLYDAVEQVRDAAAVEAMGGGFAAVEDAALAVYTAEALADRFTSFVAGNGEYEVGGDRYRIQDLHAGWRHFLRRVGVGGTRNVEPRHHPGLARELEELAHAAPETAATAGLPLDPLRPDDERALAAEALGVGARAEWRCYADLPPGVYADDIERSARRLVEAVEAVLGRPAADRRELADTLLYRAGEVRNAKEAPEQPAAEPPPWLGAAYLATVVEYTLIRRGWRREHPTVSGLLVAPEGASTVDMAELVARPEALRRHLIAAWGPAA